MPLRYACPDCSAPLTQTALVRGSCFVCSSCGGTLVNTSVLRERAGHDTFDSLWASAQSESFTANRNCPSCQKAMRTFATDDARGSVALDICGTCHTFWFDAGELQRVGVTMQGRTPQVSRSLAELELEFQSDQHALAEATSTMWTFVHYLRSEFLDALYGKWFP